MGAWIPAEEAQRLESRKMQRDQFIPPWQIALLGMAAGIVLIGARMDFVVVFGSGVLNASENSSAFSDRAVPWRVESLEVGSLDYV